MTLSAGLRVRHWRELKGIEQKELAEKTKVGPDEKPLIPSRLCRIERGKTDARVEEIEALAKALGLTMPEFYGDIAA